MQHPLCQKDRASEKANSRLSTEASPSQPADSKEAVQIEKVHDRMQAQVMPLMQPALHLEGMSFAIIEPVGLRYSFLLCDTILMGRFGDS